MIFMNKKIWLALFTSTVLLPTIASEASCASEKGVQNNSLALELAFSPNDGLNLARHLKNEATARLNEAIAIEEEAREQLQKAIFIEEAVKAQAHSLPEHGVIAKKALLVAEKATAVREVQQAIEQAADERVRQLDIAVATNGIVVEEATAVIEVQQAIERAADDRVRQIDVEAATKEQDSVSDYSICWSPLWLIIVNDSINIKDLIIVD